MCMDHHARGLEIATTSPGATAANEKSTRFRSAAQQLVRIAVNAGGENILQDASDNVKNLVEGVYDLPGNDLRLEAWSMLDLQKGNVGPDGGTKEVGQWKQADAYTRLEDCAIDSGREHYD
ncbi:unnamed protein product, partial [Amoebophrya sp. A25]|eukprot:GSA25T00019626001.1